jgi:hypothetical protein
VANETITGNAFHWSSSTQSVQSYATDYLSFDIDPTVTQFSLRFEGDPTGGGGQFSVHLILIKNNRWRTIYNRRNVTEQTWERNFSAGNYDRVVLVVNGVPTGGDYEVSINGCVSGTWRDGFNFLWTLVQEGEVIKGTVNTNSCGLYQVTGTLRGSDIMLKATGSCCDFEYIGTIVDCASGSGRWKSNCGASGNWTMSKVDPDAEADMREHLIEEEEEEHADDPATMHT